MAGESRVEDYLKRRVKATGGQLRKVKWLDRSGGLDRLVWWRFPRAAFVEVKAPKKHIDPRGLQAREARILRDTGWPTFVVSSFEEVDIFIAEMTNRVDDLK